MWSCRIMHEASLPRHTYGNCFITLTYRDRRECTEDQLIRGYFMPDDWSLNKKHFQDFFKRLRKAFPQSIRYFHVGEYGNICRHRLPCEECLVCTVGRPHYHAILFNCRFDDLEVVGRHNGVVHYTSQRLAELWKYGFVIFGS